MLKDKSDQRAVNNTDVLVFADRCKHHKYATYLGSAQLLTVNMDFFYLLCCFCNGSRKLDLIPFFIGATGNEEKYKIEQLWQKANDINFVFGGYYDELIYYTNVPR